MIDTIILHKNVTYFEKLNLLQLLNKTKHHRKREAVFFDGAVRLTMFIGQDYQYLRLNIYNVNDILRKERVNKNDYDTFCQIINNILRPYNLDLIDFILRNIHYKIDIRASYQDRQEYFYIMAKSNDTWGNIRKKPYYNDGELTGFKFKPLLESKKEVSHEITVYDKNKYMQCFPSKYKPYLQDVMRFEIKINKTMLDRQKRKHGLDKTLFNYWDDWMREYFFTELFIKKFARKGDYYNLPITRSILGKSKLEEKIIKMMKELRKNDYATIKENYSAPTINKYVNHLEQYNINPILAKTVEHLEGLTTILKNISATPAWNDNIYHF